MTGFDVTPGALDAYANLLARSGSGSLASLYLNEAETFRGSYVKIDGDDAGMIFDEPFDWDKPVSIGGPVSGPLMVLHTSGDFADQEVLPGVLNSVEVSNVRGVIRSRPEPSLVVANYSGWGPGQLEGEFDVDSWLTLPW